MGQPDTVVSELCRELGVSRQTLYRHVGPDGQLREAGRKVLGEWCPLDQGTVNPKATVESGSVAQIKTHIRYSRPEQRFAERIQD